MPIPVKDFANESDTVIWGLLSLVLTIVILLLFTRIWLDMGRRDDDDSKDNERKG